MLVTGLIDSIIIIIERLLVLNGDITTVSSGTKFILQCTNKLDFLVLIIYTTCAFLYTLLITYPNMKEKIKKLINVTLVLDIIVYSIILMSNVDLITNGSIISVSGQAIVITYVFGGLYLIISMIMALLNIGKLTKRHIPIISAIFILIILVLIFRSNPYIMIISITIAFVNSLMFFTIENPDVKLIEEINIAKESAIKASNAKTEFLSNMSHEIRTPLNAIVGFSEALQSDERIPVEAKEDIKDIVMASDSLLEIVNGILDISKIEADKLEIINTTYSPKKVFDELVVLTRGRLGFEKQIEFKTSFSSDIPATLYGDYARVKQIVLNLLTNAVKYTNEGYISFTVECVNINKDLCRLIISVEDSGIGIKKDKIDKLFTKFERLDEEQNITIEGTGLGLAITKKLVELMHGKMVVQSIYGKGSKFTVSLDQKIVATKEKEEIKEKTVVKGNYKGKRVLVVDDNKLNLKVAERLLREYNLFVDEVASGFDAIDRINMGVPYNLILMDDMMPKMSGCETLKELKKNKDFHTKTVALTANAISGMREKYLSVGFDDYLAKPIKKEELEVILDKYLREDKK